MKKAQGDIRVGESSICEIQEKSVASEEGEENADEVKAHPMVEAKDEADSKTEEYSSEDRMEQKVAEDKSEEVEEKYLVDEMVQEEGCSSPRPESGKVQEPVEIEMETDQVN